MRLDLGSFAFNCSVGPAGNNPSWGTALGQDTGYRIKKWGSENIVLGMTRQFYPKDNVYGPFGKGGKVFSGKETDEMQQVALFREVYVNDKRIGLPFIMLIQNEDSQSHAGRLSIKYNPKICIKDENGVEQYSNEQFIKKVYEVFQTSDDACWFVYDIDVVDQEKLILSAVFVDKNGPKVYSSPKERKNEWESLIPKEKRIMFTKERKPNELPDSRQQIYYGAPGTGKSYKVKELTKGKSVIRTTFHPDSDYSTFVGAYKPTMKQEPRYTDLGEKAIKMKGEDGEKIMEDRIVYDFVPQAFLLAYVKAWKLFADAKEGEEPNRQYLVVEEINRGNCAQIFGDLFQLLDRNEYGFSEYYIHADKDTQKHLEGLLKGLQISNAVKNTINNIYNEDVSEEDRVDVVDKAISGEIMLLPSNLYIMATMNTSDQSLFPIDSAFKRRWDWVYVPIANVPEKKWRIVIGNKEYGWWDFLTKINEQIGATTNSEDKKLGFFFCQAKDNVIDTHTFVNKVLFYLWNDVFKDYGFDGKLFKTTDDKPLTFDKFHKADNGEAVVDTEVVNKFVENLGIEGTAISSGADNDANKIAGASYYVNGNKVEKFTSLGKAVVEEYIKKYDDMTRDEVIDAWSGLSLGLKRGMLIRNKEDSDKWLSGEEKVSTGYVQVPVMDSFVHVLCHLEEEDCDKIMQKVNQQDWGIHIEKVE